MEDQKKGKSTMAIASLILGIIGLITSCVIIGLPFCAIGLLLGIVVLYKRKPGEGFAIIGIILSGIGIIIFCVMLSVAINNTGSVEKDITSEAQELVPNKDSISSAKEINVETVTQDSKVEDESTQSPTVEETESADEYKKSCEEVGYKKLLRNPDEYIGKRIAVVAEVKQTIDGGIFDENKYYRVQTDNDGYEYYLDDEYFMYDDRIDDNMKILDGDVLKIYGEFSGLETVKRAMTKAKDEVPGIKAYYIELIGE